MLATCLALLVSLQTCEHSNAQVRDLCDEAGWAMSRKDYAKAIAQYGKVLALDAGHVQAYVARAGCYLSTQDYERAISDFSEVIRRDARNPRIGEIYYDRARAKLYKGDAKGALEDCEKSAPSGKQWLDFAELCEDNDELDIALKAVSRYVDANPKKYFGYVRRARVQLQRNDLTAALADARKSLELSPSWDGVSVFADILAAQGDLEGAIKEISKYIKANGGYEYMYFKRAALRKQKGDFEAAMADYTKAVDESEEPWNALIDRGWARIDMIDFSGAAEDFTEALTLDPEGEHMIFYARSHARRLAQNERALEDANKAVAKDETCAQCTFNRGLVHAQWRRWLDAYADMSKAAALSPKFDAARQYLWLIRQQSGSREAANKELSDYLAAREPKRADDWFAKSSRFLLGQLSEEQLLKEVETGSRKVAENRRCEAHFLIGMRRVVAQEREKAAESLKKFVELAKGRAGAAEITYAYGIAVAELKRLGK